MHENHDKPQSMDFMYELPWHGQSWVWATSTVTLGALRLAGAPHTTLHFIWVIELLLMPTVKRTGLANYFCLGPHKLLKPALEQSDRCLKCHKAFQMCWGQMRSLLKVPVVSHSWEGERHKIFFYWARNLYGQFSVLVKRVKRQHINSLNKEMRISTVTLWMSYNLLTNKSL